MEYPGLMKKNNSLQNQSMAIYRSISLTLGIVFAVAGLLFLFIPEVVLRFFDELSIYFGLQSSNAATINFYHILAVGYMYIVTLLAWLMFSHPENRYFPVLLINAKTVSSILSFVFFFGYLQTLIYLVNGVVDGLIAAGVFFIYRMQRRTQ